MRPNALVIVASWQHADALDLLFQRVNHQRGVHCVIVVFAREFVDECVHLAQAFLGWRRHSPSNAARSFPVERATPVLASSAREVAIGPPDSQPVLLPLRHELLRLAHLDHALLRANLSDEQFTQLCAMSASSLLTLTRIVSSPPRDGLATAPAVILQDALCEYLGI